MEKKNKQRRYVPKKLIDVGGAGQIIQEQIQEEDELGADDGFIADIVETGKYIADLADYGKSPEQKKQEIGYEQSQPYSGLVDAGWISPDMAMAMDGVLGFPHRIAERAGVTRAAQNVASGVMGIPGAVTNIYGLASAGVEAGYENAVNDKPFAEAFQESIIDENGQKTINDALTVFVKGLQADNPNLTEKELTEKLEAYQDSDAFQQVVYENLRPGLSWGMLQNWTANRYAGMLRRPDEQTVVDDLWQMVGGNIVGVPKKTAQKITARLAQGAIKDVLNKPGVRPIAQLAEMLTPVTVPMTTRTFINNTGVGTVVTPGMNMMLEHLNNEQQLQQQENPEGTVPIPPMKPELYEQFMDEPVATDGDMEVSAKEEADILGQAAQAVGLSVLGIMSGKYAKQAAREFGSDIRIGGPTFDQQRQVADPNAPQDVSTVGSRAAFAVDQMQPIKHAARKTIDEKTAKELEAVAANNTGVGGKLAVDNAVQHGILDGLNYTAVPLQRVQRMYGALPEEQQRLFNDFVIYQNALDDRLIQRSGIDTELRAAQIAELDKRLQGEDTSTELAKIAELQQKLDKWEKGLERPNMTDLSDEQLKNTINIARNTPDVMAVADQYKKMVDALADYRYKQGDVDSATLAEWKNARQYYMPMWQDPFEGAKGLARKGQIFKQKFKNALSNRNDGIFGYTLGSTRDLTNADYNVTRPLNPLDAINLYIDRTVRTVQANKARRQILETLAKADNPTVRKVKTLTRKQSRLPQMSNFMDTKKYTQVAKDGQIDIWEVPDETLKASLDFMPAATAPLFLNATRRLKQQLTTGLAAPGFATKALMWDTTVGQVTKPKGRSMGLISYYTRALLQDSKLANEVLDIVDAADFTAYLATLAAIPSQLMRRSQRAYAEKIVNDLASHSGVFNQLAKSPAMKALLTKSAQTAIRNFDESAYAIISNRGFGKNGFLVDPMDARTEFDKILNIGAPKYAREALSSYVAVLEALHNSAKYAYFSQNYVLLKRKYKQNKIPKRELDKLIYETKSLSGDMTRVGGSNTYNTVASTIPYMNAAAQSMRHVYGGLYRNPGTVGTRMMIAVVMPKLYGDMLMANWDTEASEYWFERTPAWKRMSTVVIPKPQAVIAWAAGQPIQFTPDMIYELPLAPEFAPIADSTSTFMRSMGFYKPSQTTTPTNMPREIQNAMSALTGFMWPPVIQAAAASGGIRLNSILEPPRTSYPKAGGGLNAENISGHSEISENFLEVVTSIAGSLGGVGVRMFDAYDTSKRDGLDFDEAAAKAVSFGTYEMRQKFQDVPLLNEASAMIWGDNTKKKDYKYVASSERIGRDMQHVERLLRQGSADRDSRGRARQDIQLGIKPPLQSEHPVARDIITMAQNRLSRGEWGRLTRQRSDYNHMLHQIDGNQSKYSPARLQAMKNNIVQGIQDIDMRRSQLIDQWIIDVNQQYGDMIEQETGGNDAAHISRFVESLVRDQ